MSKKARGDEPPKCLAKTITDRFALYHGDTCEVIKGIPENSVHYSIFSPPFDSLYTYSASERDMGNSDGKSTFAEHFNYLIPEILRITKPGRLLSFHCMQLTQSITQNGVIGLRDFRGELIAAFVKAGWIYHSEVCIWKNPVTAMQRTKALGLLHKQIKKDSSMSRQGIADYLVTMRKPGLNDAPVKREVGFTRYVGIEPPDNTSTMPDGAVIPSPPGTERYSINVWQRYASPVWFDVDAGDTLQTLAEEKDERHICPLQLQVIERAIELWTNPNDTVFTPFAGIGSEVYQAIKMKRRGIGIELKEAYFKQAVKNCKSCVEDEIDLYSGLGDSEEIEGDE